MNTCWQCHLDFDFEDDGGIEVRKRVSRSEWVSIFYYPACYDARVVRITVPVDESKVVDL